jgi:glycosyltransferase involved in cell wall biosynthesis
MYLEWHGFRRYAASLKPDLWLSLHDVTPSVGATRQAVYCHNPMPFHRLSFRDAWLQPAMMCFRYLYQFAYRLHLRRNYAVIVQQQWLRDEFRRWTGPAMKIVVAHPAVGQPTAATAPPGQAIARNSGARFLYPAVPRVFKNIELLCRAALHLEQGRPRTWYSEIILTTNGQENRYARWLWRTFGHLKSVRFAGRQTPEQMRQLYDSTDCLLFPSRLETWGLPITEAKSRGLAMLVADLPYAHETVGAYDKAAFIDSADHIALAEALLSFQDGSFRFQGSAATDPAAPYARDWRELLALLTAGMN